MTKAMFNSLMLCTLITGIAWCQDPASGAGAAGPSGPRKSTSEKEGSALDREVQFALRTSPEILLAQAKLQEAQAALLAARMQVTQQAIARAHERQIVDSRLSSAQKALDRATALSRAGNLPESELAKAEDAVLELLMQRTQIHARDRLFRQNSRPGEQDFVTLSNPKILVDGPNTTVTSQQAVVGKDVSAATHPGTSAAETPLSRSLADTFTGVLEGPPQALMSDLFKGTKIRVILDQVLDSRYVKSPPQLAKFEFSGTREEALTAIADLLEIGFVVRPYGLFVTTQARAKNYRASTIPAYLGQ